MADPTINIVVKAVTGQAEKALGGMTGKLKGMGGLAKTAGLALAGGIAAVGTAAVAAAGAITKFTVDAAALEGVRQTFDNLAQSIGTTSEALLIDLRGATRSMVADSDLMQAANKFMSMGLAGTQEEAARLAEMATQLGMAMGVDATTAMEDFALMLANQSIPRLDTFGISSGTVRERINELMAETEGLTREQAFMQAVMEQGTITMDKVGEQSENAGARMAMLRASIDNAKLAIGQAFLPVFEQLLGGLANLAQQWGPRVVAWAEVAGAWLGENLPIAIDKLTRFWNEKLYPALETIWNFLQQYFFPVLEFLADTVLNNVKMEVNALTVVWDKVLKPVLEAVWQFLSVDMLPIWEALEELLGVAVPLVLTALQGIWENVLLPAMTAVWEFIKDKLGPIFEWLKEHVVDPLLAAFGGLADIIAEVAGWISSLTDKLRNIKLPDWMTPGSPTPWELGLRGVADAMQELNEVSLPTMQARLMGGGGGVITNNHNYNLSIHTSAQAESALSDFHIMRALAGV